MQRVRIGITGLAVVFLLVLLTAALIRTVRNGPGARPLATAATSRGGTGPADTPHEPLAELGVAPGDPAPETNSMATLAGRSGPSSAPAAPSAKH